MFVSILKQLSLVFNYSFWDYSAIGIGSLFEYMKNKYLEEAESVFVGALNNSIKAVGERSLLTAKIYTDLGRMYPKQNNYDVIFVFFNWKLQTRKL